MGGFKKTLFFCLKIRESAEFGKNWSLNLEIRSFWVRTGENSVILVQERSTNRPFWREDLPNCVVETREMKRWGDPTSHYHKKHFIKSPFSETSTRTRIETSWRRGYTQRSSPSGTPSTKNSCRYFNSRHCPIISDLLPLN